MQYKNLVALNAAGEHQIIVWAFRGEFKDMNAENGHGWEASSGRYFLGDIDGPEVKRVSELAIENPATGDMFSLVASA
ncbi:hypothetical protein NKK52_19730 [Mesorhizobium sp. C277A]|uniref:hypothetical protein n=1 Tax=Mesorhizobium sp. C277A TaxID=2956827 RepID=UPI0003CE8869|nr:hypothetical protein [Mesorhizobium sp. LSJC277A00]ESW67741.1 hypothetical protein X771_13525 [Mesorhizobium sp. LSJC277A00]